MAYSSRPTSRYFTPSPSGFDQWDVVPHTAPTFDMAKNAPELMQDLAIYAKYVGTVAKADTKLGALITKYSEEILPDGAPVPLTDPSYLEVQTKISPLDGHWFIIDADANLPLDVVGTEGEAQERLHHRYIRLLVFGQPLYTWVPPKNGDRNDAIEVRNILVMVMNATVKILIPEEREDAYKLYVGHPYYPNGVQRRLDAPAVVNFLSVIIPRLRGRLGELKISQEERINVDILLDEVYDALGRWR